MTGAAMLYSLILFGIGFLFAIPRELVLIPRFGADTGILLELPFMAAAILIAGPWLIGRLRVPREVLARAGFGLMALAFLLALELGLTLAQGGTVAGWLDSHRGVRGAVTFILYTLFASLPLALVLISRRSMDANS